MDNIHDDGNAHLVSSVNHLLQVLRCTKTTGGSEEAGYVIAKRAIVGMLLNSHHLNGIVAVLLDARQYILGEFLIGAHLLGILTHTHVALVNQQRRLVGFEIFLFPLIGFLRVPYLRRENLCLVVLNHTTAPSGNALAFSPIPLYLHLVKLSVLEGFLTEFQFPVASTLNALALIFLRLLPIVEITNQVNLCSIGSPLTEHPTFSQFMESKIQMTRSKLREC